MKNHLTAEKIANLTNDKNGLANIRAINKLYRGQDDSHLYPILGKFNNTERAIRKVRKFAQHMGGLYGLEYALSLEYEMSENTRKEQ